MNVLELIEYLKKFPLDTEICVDYDGGYELQAFAPLVKNRSELSFKRDFSVSNSKLVIVHQAF